MPVSSVAQSHTFSTALPCQLFAHLPDAHLVVTPHDDATVDVTVHVEASEERAQEVLAQRPIAVRKVEQTIRIQPKTTQSPRATDWWRVQRQSHPPITVEVRVPVQTNADLQVPGGSVEAANLEGQVTVECAGGTVSLRDMQGRLEVQAFNGRVSIARFSGPLLSVRGAGRAVEIEAIEAQETHLRLAATRTHLQDVQGSVSIALNGGSVTGTDLHGPLSVEAQGGALTIHTPPAPVDLRATGTDVTLHLDHPCQMHASAHAVQWKTKAPPLSTCTNRQVHGTLMGGGPPMRATVIGSALTLALS